MSVYRHIDCFYFLIFVFQQIQQGKEMDHIKSFPMKEILNWMRFLGFYLEKTVYQLFFYYLILWQPPLQYLIQTFKISANNFSPYATVYLLHGVLTCQNIWSIKYYTCTLFTLIHFAGSYKGLMSLQDREQLCEFGHYIERLLVQTPEGVQLGLEAFS